VTVDTSEHRRLGVELFNHVWTLLEKPERTPAEDDEMVHAAHASAYHWRQVGTPAHFARSEWQCSRVYAVLGRAEPALWHARRCLEFVEEHPDEMEPWDEPFAHEALARAYGAAGDAEAVRRHGERARAGADAVDDDEDRDHLLAALATLGA
jgi:hypothetical protein